MARKKQATPRPGRVIARKREEIVKRLQALDTGEMKRLTSGRRVGWQTLYRVATGRSPDPHVSVLEEIEDILARG